MTPIGSYFIVLQAFLIYSIILLPSTDATGTVHKCVHATRKLSKLGTGTTKTSCMGCRPALADCYKDCQTLVDKVYLNCDGVCLPNGYYFDPQSEIAGCWEAAKPELKIKTERCGCDSAFKFSNLSFSALLLIIIMCIYLFL